MPRSVAILNRAPLLLAQFRAAAKAGRKRLHPTRKSARYLISTISVAAVAPIDAEVRRISALPTFIPEADCHRLRRHNSACIREARQRHEVALQRALMLCHPSRRGTGIRSHATAG